jgi:hypothetical protein
VLLYPNKEVKHLAMDFDRRLTWAKHIKARRKQINLQAKQLHCLLETDQHYQQKATAITQSSAHTHLDFRHWNTRRFQSEAPRSILNAPSYINSSRIHADLQVNQCTAKYLNKLALTVNLLGNSERVKRLKRYSVLNLPDRFESGKAIPVTGRGGT